MITKEDLLAAGYRAFTQKHIKQYTDSHYQKCIYSELGKKYYITLSCYDNRKYQDRLKIEDFSYEASGQFTDSLGNVFNVEMLHPSSVECVEEFFENLWAVLDCEYYERYDE